VGHEQVFVAVAIDVAYVDTHRRLRLAGSVEGATVL
jgi:hypothetical protein